MPMRLCDSTTLVVHCSADMWRSRHKKPCFIQRHAKILLFDGLEAIRTAVCNGIVAVQVLETRVDPRQGPVYARLWPFVGKNGIT